MTRKITEILRYQKKGLPRSTVKRYYYIWRGIQNPILLERCDNIKCIFYKKKLMWNNSPLKPILDHINGNNSDNRPKNLRLLCPNCDSQLDTRGGANKGRIEKSDGGFTVKLNGKKHYVLPAETGEFILK